MNEQQIWAVESADGTAMGEGMTERQARRSVEERRAKGIECYAVNYAKDEDEDLAEAS